VEDYYAKFRISDALMTIYRLFWDSYCSWYLELVKPPYGEAVDGRTYEATVTFFDKLLKLIHPVMPFISEELWQSMEERREGETIMFQRTPLAGPVDENFLEDFVLAQGAVNGVRAVRAQKQISPKKELELYISGGMPSELFPIISKLANVKIFEGEAEGQASTFLVGTLKFGVPLSDFVDTDEEKKRLEDELRYQKGFLEGVRKKLGNANFVANAPEAVVAGERKKEADALSRIEALEKSLTALEK
jgi:valyl-tRNA synthetase